MVGFEFLDTPPTHTGAESLLMVDRSPIISGYNNRHCEKRPFPSNCRYPVAWLEERTFGKSWRCSHQFISEGNQNPRQEQETRARIVANWWMRNPPLKELYFCLPFPWVHISAKKTKQKLSVREAIACSLYITQAMVKGESDYCETSEPLMESQLLRGKDALCRPGRNHRRQRMHWP